MTKEQFEEIIKTKGALGEGYIIESIPELYQESNLTGISYKIKFKNCMNANWSKMQGRIKYTIKELRDILDAKVSLFKFEVFNGSNNKFYNIVLMVKGIEYDKLPER